MTAVDASLIQAEVRWVGGIGFAAHGMGGATLLVDQSVDKGGTGVGFRPMELLLHALATCLGTTIVQILAKQRIPLRDYRIHVRGERAVETPARYTHIVVEHVFVGDGLAPANLERIVTLVDDKYCSVSATLPRGLVEHRVLVGSTSASKDAAHEG